MDSFVSEKHVQYATKPAYKRLTAYTIALTATWVLVYCSVPTDFSASVSRRWHAHYTSRDYTCPHPTSVPIEHSRAFRHLSAATDIPSSDPAFAILISHSLNACNAFRLELTRTEAGHCEERGEKVDASFNPETDDFIKTTLGPDMFQLKFDGAERKVIHTPTNFSEENCRYTFDVQLNAAGPVWLQLHQVYGDYDAMHEVPDHAPQSVWSSLFATPLKLDICPPTCATYIPPPVGQRDFAYPARPEVAKDNGELPSCSGPDPIPGVYVHTNPLSILDPTYEVPMSLYRPVAGFYDFVPAGCKYDHAGLRFRNHDACFDKPHRALFIGDSHTGSLCHGVTHRFTGGLEIAGPHVNGVPLHQTFRGSEVEFVWDPVLLTTALIPPECDLLNKFDSITLSTGAHQLAFSPVTCIEFFDTLRDRMQGLMNRVRECSTGALPTMIWAGTTAHNSEGVATHPLDSRSGQRLEYLTRTLNTIAREIGYSVVDTFALTQPIAPDTVLLDGIHFLRTDAQDPLIDDWIEKSGFCYSD